MANTAITIIVLLILFVGSVWLQIYLSKSKNKWLGLIIPFICFMFSIFIVLSLSMLTNMRTTSMTNTIDGVVVIDKTVSSQSEKPSMISMLATVIPVFLMSNIPTLIFLAIYFACREKLKLRKELDKMNVQDLE
jgi:vacuolar-type H+-ATPase subunit I/STV1